MQGDFVFVREAVRQVQEVNCLVTTTRVPLRKSFNYLMFASLWNQQATVKREQEVSIMRGKALTQCNLFCFGTGTLPQL